VPEHGRMPELLAKGVKVALGCDSPNNSNHLDIVRAMNMAAIQYKDARQDTRLIPPRRPWRWRPSSALRHSASTTRSARSSRARKRPGALRHAAAGVAGRSSTRSTTCLTADPAACTPVIWRPRSRRLLSDVRLEAGFPCGSRKLSHALRSRLLRSCSHSTWATGPPTAEPLAAPGRLQESHPSSHGQSAAAGTPPPSWRDTR